MKMDIKPAHEGGALILGGSGFIGQHLVKRLAVRGDRIVIADIRPPRRKLPPGVEYVKCDVRLPIVDIPLSSPELIVNLAAVHRTPGHPDREYYETNCLGARNVVAYAANEGVPTIWFTSSISVYGSTESKASEADIPRPESAYGRSKREAERIHCAWQKGDPARRLLTVRPAAIFGPGEGGNFTRLGQLLKKGLFVYPGRRDTVKSCGYVEDLIDALFFMEALNDGSTLFNFCYPERLTIDAIAVLMAHLGGYRPPLGSLPLTGIVFAARALELAERKVGPKMGFHPERVMKLVRSTNILPEVLMNSGFSFSGGLVDGLTRWFGEKPRGEFC